MVAISRNLVSIWIANSGVVPSAAAVSTNLITGEIKAYNRSGGETEVETEYVFGGNIDKVKPTTQVEISLDIVPKVDTNANKWDAMSFTSDDIGVYTMAGTVTGTSAVAGSKSIFIQAKDGSSHKSWAFNNCKVTQFELEHNADDVQTGKLTFKFSPETEGGVSNFMTAASAMTSMPRWNQLDNN